ncbi:DEAD/DEAH box helicase family protein [Streptomyces sp. MS2A]|nr:DEAD/DEAH box helicase family protein [Streptomyces sp. MS2A]
MPTEDDLPVSPAFALEEPGETPFDALLDEFRAMADSRRVQGAYLEELVRHYLRLDPLRSGQFRHVWLWRDWPGRDGRGDTGIDLVAETTDGDLFAIQVKFFAADHRMRKSDLDSFFEAVGREPFVGGIVVDTTSGRWSTNAEDALKNRTKRISRITLQELRHSQIDWSTYRLTAPERAPRLHGRRQLRPHQHEAVQATLRAFTEDRLDRGTLVMACGTGKTFTALKIAERYTREQGGGRSMVLFAVPSLALLQQALEEWSREHDPDMPFRAFAIGSDPRLGRVANGDLTTVALEDLAAPATTDGATLFRLLEEIDLSEGMTVVFSTYQSIQAVSDAQGLGVPAFDLVICDEAHRTTGVRLAEDEDPSEFVKIHDPRIIDAERRLSMTATPRIYAPEAKSQARQRDVELVSMDDETLFGPVVYRLGFGEAVERGLLTDYKVLVLGVSEDQVARSFVEHLRLESHELPLTDVAKLIGCWNALAKRQSGHLADGFGGDITPMRRAVAFTRDIKTSRKVEQDFPYLVRAHLQDRLNDDPTDDLGVECRHVDGTMNATERGALLQWLREDPGIERPGPPTARVLTNARCLSEGVDVPGLDAVLFLSARKSQVDVVQAVGRVMRRAEGKTCGYIVLPVAIPEQISGEEALKDNERYRVVWQVLQALRSHDERLDAQINRMGLTGRSPETVVVAHVDLTASSSPARAPGEIGAVDHDPDVAGRVARTRTAAVSPTLPLFGADDWKDAVYAKLVKKVGDRLYWDDWADDVSGIAQTYVTLIGAHLDSSAGDRGRFQAFLRALRATVNPEIAEHEAIELLAQHLITMPVFDAMFPDDSFTRANPVSLTMQEVIDSFSENAAFAREREPLESFYSGITDHIRRLPDFTSKQRLLVTLYDRFFAKAFPKLADRMGIVFTPVDVVDYILRSADDAFRAAFDRGLGDRGVRILDPFTGTGTFLTRLLQLGLVPPENLAYKYRHDLFANEVVLLSYYIAAVNLESVFRELTGTTPDAGEAAFPGISLTDTFAMDERDHELAGGVFPENTERLERQRRAPIDVIVMNPPYSVGQRSANDDNQNARYPALDARIEETYAKRSTATLKNSLYDSYFRALRWATDRIGDEGVIAFVSNSGFVDGNTADGVRLAFGDEFSDVFLYDLRGGIRGRVGDAARNEGGNVFDIMTGVVIAVLVKRAGHVGPARIRYRSMGDAMTREQKLDALRTEASLRGSEFRENLPNAAGDWLNQRDERFGAFRALSGPDGVFALSSNGLKTNRDAWCVNFDRTLLRANVRRHVDFLNGERRRVRSLAAGGTRPRTLVTRDPRRGSWDRVNLGDVDRDRETAHSDAGYREGVYRPFVRTPIYFDPTQRMNNCTYQLPRLFPTPAHPNRAIAVNARGADVPLMVDAIPDLHVVGDAQVFARWRWEPLAAPTGLDLGALDGLDPTEDEVVVDGYRRVDNITDETLARYRRVYEDDELTKDDVFSAVYAILHHPEYRARYEADLKRVLPRIPVVADIRAYVRTGEALAALHLGYEAADGFPLAEVWAIDAPTDDDASRYAIDRMTWTTRRDRSAIRYNAFLTLTGIPEEAHEYRIGGRSPLEWILDRYRVRVDAQTGIVNDPNAWLRDRADPRYVVRLIGSLVTLSMQTRLLIAGLPPFEVLDA